MSRYLVTGGAGFVGSHLCESLLRDGHSLIAVDSFTDYYARAIKEGNIETIRTDSGFDLVEADLATHDLQTALDSVDGVFHLAAQAGVRRSWGDSFDVYLRDNLLATQRLFEAALKRGVRVVFASSSSVYGDAEAYPTPEETVPAPISPYGITKLACEHLAQAYGRRGLDAVGLRYFTIYGPRQRPDMAYTRIALCLMRETPFVIFGDGNQSRDVTYVGDAVSATIAAMVSGVTGSLYNVGGGSETSLLEAINVFEQAAGKGLSVEHIEAAAGDVVRTAGTTRKIERDTDWRPEFSLEAGIDQHMRWAKSFEQQS